MEDADFSDAFCRFIQTNIPTVEAAELLLAFYREGGEPLSAPRAAERLGPGSTLTAAEAAKLLESFQSLGLVAKEGDAYRYRAGNDAAFVDVLSQAYRERPVTLVRIIYALRDSKIQSFAEAFRLRKR
jgi:hypothetical protein